MHSWLSALVFVFCSIPVLGVCATSTQMVAEGEISGTDRVASLLSLSERLEQSLASSTADTLGEEFSEAADLFGKLVARGQERKGDAGFFLALRNASENLYGSCRDFIRAKERSVNEDEAALEQLYRSETWYDLNYALASFRYWQAWIDLSIARLQSGENERAGWLNRAESEFQTASVRILYPGIVYGSWMGMGYVSLARDDRAQARRRFSLLLEALKNYPDYPFRETAEVELALLDPKNILATKLKVDESITSSAQARLAQEQAFVLLEQHRREKGGAIQAAQLLKSLLNSRWLSDALVNRLMQFVEEIAGQDIGILGLLVDAEYAYRYQQYHTAVIKYREFMTLNGGELLLNLAPYRYQFATSLQLIGLHQEALRELEEVKRLQKLPGPLLNALAKLQFVVSESLYKQHHSQTSKKRLLTAAKEYLSTGSQDRDKAAAHLAMARFGKEQQLAAHLKLAAANSEYRSAADQVRLQRALDKFRKVLSAIDSRIVKAAAAETLSALDRLPRKLRNRSVNRCLAVQMKTVLMQRPDKILQEISRLEMESEPAQECRQIIIWSKLRVLTALNDYLALSAMIVRAHGDMMTHQDIFIFLRDLKNRQKFAELEAVASLFVSVLNDTPDMLRQVQLMRIENLQAANRGDEAFHLAQELLQKFPKSGNSWVAYAKAAELTGQLDSAARGWSQITSAAPEGSPKWIEGMLMRADLAVRGGQPSSRTCTLLKRLAVYKHLFEEKVRGQFPALVQVSRCQNLLE